MKNTTNIYVVLLFAFALSSCNLTKEKKQLHTYHKFDKLKTKCISGKFSSFLAIVPPKWCDSNYALKQDKKVITKYIKGIPQKIKGETVYIDYNCDSAIRAANLISGGFIGDVSNNQKQVIRTIKIPVEVISYLQVDTSAILSEVTKVSTAKLDMQKIETDKLLKENEKLAKDKKSFLGIALGEGGILFLLIIGLLLHEAWKVRSKVV